MADKVTLRFKADKWERFLVRMPMELSRDEAPLALKRLALDAMNRIIRRTPVDLGRAQAGWAPFMDANGSPVTISGPNVTQDAISQGRRDGSYTQQPHEIEITNGVPYILFLEMGAKGRRPHAMVRATMRELAGKNIAGKEMKKAVDDAATAAGAS